MTPLLTYSRVLPATVLLLSFAIGSAAQTPDEVTPNPALVRLAQKVVDSGRGPEFFAPADPVAKRTLPLVVTEPSGVDRTNWPIRGGIPIPRGELLDPSSVRLLDGHGREIPVQARQLAMWPALTVRNRPYARSVQWLLLTFVADLRAGRDNLFVLEYGSNVKAIVQPTDPVHVRANDDGLVVGNQKVQLALSNLGPLIRSITVSDRTVVTNGSPSLNLNLDVANRTGDIPPIVAIPTVAATAPEIDGRINDPAWVGARRIELHDFRLAGPPENPTKGLLLIDDAHLYVAIECIDHDMANIQAPDRPHDDFDIRYDDHITVFIDPAYTGPTRKAATGRKRESPNFVALSVSASGVVREQLLNGGMTLWDPEMAATNPDPFKTGCELTIPGLLVRTSQQPDRWTVEMKIPLSSVRANWIWTGKGKWHSSDFTYLTDRRYADTFGVSLYRHRAARPTSGGGDQRWPYSLSYLHCPPMKMARIPAPGTGQDYDPLAEQISPKPTESADVLVDEIAVEQPGPVEAVVRVTGRFVSTVTDDSSFTARFGLYAGQALIRCQFTVHLGFDRYSARLASYSLDLPVADPKETSLNLVDGTALPAPHPSQWAQYRHDSYRQSSPSSAATRGGQLLGTAATRSKNLPITLAMRHFWERHPAGFTFDTDKLSVDMYSPAATPVFLGLSGELQDDYGSFALPRPTVPEPARVNSTHEVWISFENVDAAAFGRAVRQIVLPYAGAQWNCATKARGLMAPYDRARFPLVEDHNDYALWWAINETHWRRWYGWGDYGNTMNSPRARQAVNHSKLYEWGYLRRGGYGWANDRKCIGLGHLTAWYRSGGRAWLDFGEAVIRNATDICANYPVPADGDYPMCRPRRHAQLAWARPQGTAARQGGQPGWILFYLLTGDERTLDAILMHLRQHTEAHDGGTNTSSVHATRYVEYRHIIAGWELTGDDRYRDILDTFNRDALKPALKTGNWATAPRRFSWRRALEGKARMVTTWGDSMMAMGHELGQYEGPLRYYQLTGDPDMAQVLVIMAAGPGLPTDPQPATRPIAKAMILADGFTSPMMRYADLYRWTRHPQLLADLTGSSTVDALMTGPLTSSPVQPATPSQLIHPRDFCRRLAEFPKLPCDYLYPSGLTFRPLILYTLNQLAESDPVLRE